MPEHPLSARGELDGLRALAQSEPAYPELAPAARRALVARWADRAHNEGSTSNAFERIGEVLAARGAPGELREVATRAVEDEARHGRICALVADHYAGTAVPVEPPLVIPPPRFTGCTPEQSALLYVVLQCAIFEGIASVYMKRCLETASTELTREVSRSILRDEVRHARLGFTFLSLLTAGERSFVELALPKLVTTALELWLAGPHDPALPAGHGCLRHDELERTVVAALSELVVPGFEHVGIRTERAREALERVHLGRLSTLAHLPSGESIPR